MKITINQVSSFTGKAANRFNKGDAIALKQNRISRASQSYAGRQALSSYDLSITLNALAFGTYSVASRRRNADGNFYTITFPDDFVHTINDTGTISVADQAGSVTIPKDPFAGYRSASSPYQIDAAVEVTIEIPNGMSIGSNSHARHVDPNQVKLAWSDEENHTGFNPDPADSEGAKDKATFYLQASADPCFFFDFDSPKVTEATLTTSAINIENSGNTIGGGGFGGRGNYTVQSGKGASQKAGGGGGGGLGLHQTYSSTTDIDAPHLFNNRDYNKLLASSGRTLGGLPDETIGTESGVGGQSGNFGQHVASYSNNPSANGVAGTLAEEGSPGGVGNHNNLVTVPSATAQSAATGGYGGWGGNVIYLKSNVFTDSALSGLEFNITNKSDGFMFAGAGGGGGGVNISGAGGRGGTWYGSDGDGIHGGGTTTSNGIRGMMFFINTANVSVTKSFTNENSGFGFKGRDV